MAPSAFDKGAYKHCEYHGLLNVQVDPAAHWVGPVHCCPPHWPHFGAVPPLLLPAVVVVVVVVRTGVVVGDCPPRVVVRVVVTVEVTARVVEVGPRVVVETGVDPPSGLTTFCHAKVELIGPHLMSEKAT